MEPPLVREPQAGARAVSLERATGFKTHAMQADALRRIADGTFGTCIVDRGPIEQQRLDAVPWTQYCLKHATRLEAAASARMPTL